MIRDEGGGGGRNELEGEEGIDGDVEKGKWKGCRRTLRKGERKQREEEEKEKKKRRKREEEEMETKIWRGKEGEERWRGRTEGGRDGEVGRRKRWRRRDGD